MVQQRFSDAVYDKAQAELERVREKNKLIRRRNIDEMNRKVPKLAELADALHSARIAFLKDGKNGAAVDKITAERDALMEKHGYTRDVYKPIYCCEVCEDSGTKLDYSGRCECYEKILLKIAGRDSGLSTDNLPTFADFDVTLYDDKVARMGRTHRQVAEQILKKAKKFSSGNMCLGGAVGLGKTFTAECIASDWIERGKLVSYYSATRLFLMLNEYYFEKKKAEHEGKIQLIYAADLLIIDDLGTEFRNSFTESMFFDIINTRLREGKSTIISTNLTTSEIRDNYSERVSSRIVGNYEILEFSGGDIREKKKLLR